MTNESQWPESASRLSESEQRQLERADYKTAPQCITQLFEAQVERAPAALAVCFENREVTYAELNERANRLAHYLREKGVGPEQLVGLCVERSVEMVVGLLGILKAGGAYLPLDPTYPPERLRYMITDAGVRVLLTHKQPAEEFVESGIEVVRLDQTIEKLAKQSAANPTVQGSGANLAYVIYTSGSTGRPKGVMIQHLSLCNLAVAQARLFHLHPRSRVLQFASISFDASVSEIFKTFVAGGALILASPACILVGAELSQALTKNAITAVTLPPSILATLTEQDFPKLETIVVAGEACSAELAARWSKVPHFINAYGPTETTVCATIGEGEYIAGRPPSIGYAIDNSEILVLDESLSPVGVGITGELYVGGIGVARGYLRRPEQTAERFVPHPYSANEGERLYRTGDLVKYRENGELEYIGRMDHQVKVRGHRIELGEIEAVLNSAPGVQRAAVLLREETSGDKRLVAYVTQKRFDISTEPSDSALEAEQLAQWKTVHDDVIVNKTDVDHDPAFNISGWNSSYTGEPIPAAEMREWVDDAVERVLAQKPRRVLEIGCGTGLMMFRIAPHCEHYFATDFSPAALSYIREQLGDALPHVSLSERNADDFTGIEPASWDAVIINSVVQYFPALNYLIRVLRGAVDAVAPGGSVFIGDVRSLPLLDAFYASVELHKAEDGLSLVQLRQRIERRVDQEEELVIDPCFFTALKTHLPRIKSIRIEPKRGHSRNELMQFRYQVTISVGDPEAVPEDLSWIDWSTCRWDLVELRRQLIEAKPQTLALTNVTNARVAAATRIRDQIAAADNGQTPAELKEMIRTATDEGIDPEELYALGNELSYEVHLSWVRHSADGSLDLLFRRAGAIAPRVHFLESTDSKALHDYANHPLRGKQARQFGPQLRSFLKERLPEHMMPASFVILDELPLLPNGKIDRRALPAPDVVRPETSVAYVEPRTELERLLATLWEEILGTEPVGRDDNFFDLGGDSFGAALFLNRLQAALNEAIYVVALFDAPSLQELAKYLEEKYPDAIARKYGSEYRSSQEDGEHTVDEAKVAQFRSLISVSPSAKMSTTVSKNPLAIFILSPPRSGSTLLRVMLAGHPELFAPPELQLLPFDTLADRKQVFSGRYSFWLEGTIRALMEINGGDADDARQTIEDFERQKLPTQEFYLHLQKWIGRKTLVDKTPAYALHLETLQKAEVYFENARYIHLLRDPRGMIRSFQDAKLDQIFRYDHPYTVRELAELIWIVCHQNILKFLATIPPERQQQVRFEELVTEPRSSVEALCRFLELDFHEEMLTPHKAKERKMTDGIHGLSRMLGDVKFHQHSTIDARIAERWRAVDGESEISDVTQTLAEELGYNVLSKSEKVLSAMQ